MTDFRDLLESLPFESDAECAEALFDVIKRHRTSPDCHDGNAAGVIRLRFESLCQQKLVMGRETTKLFLTK